MSARLSLALLLLTTLIGCSGTTPVTPSKQASPTVSELKVGIAGNSQPIIEPGKSVQLYAQTTMSDGSVQDVTNQAVWQSTNPVVAVVSTAGLVTTYAEGDVSINATLSKTASIALQVKRQCSYMLSPASMDLDAFGRASIRVNVTTSLASCGWTVQTTASWLRLLGAGTGTGNGMFDYDVSGNSTTAPREADIVVAGGGGNAAHHVSQARPAGCSYVVEPSEVAVSLGGGSGSFRVDVTPDDCQWKALSAGSVYATNASAYTSTTGDYTVQYRAYAAANGAVGTISICGLSGANPCGIFTVRWRN